MQLQTSIDAMKSLSIDGGDQRRAPLQQLQNTSQRPTTSLRPSSNMDTLSATENCSSDSDESATTSTATETKVIRKRKVLRWVFRHVASIICAKIMAFVLCARSPSRDSRCQFSTFFLPLIRSHF